MEKAKKILVGLVLSIIFTVFSYADEFSYIISTEWLEKNLNNSDLVIIDIRKADVYKAKHIPNSINVLYSAWAIEKSGRKNELPEEDDLQDLITSAGINDKSLIVIVGNSDNITELVNMTRVAWTLYYAGLNKVAVLDGGFTKWEKEGRPTTTEIKKVKPGNFKIKLNRNIYADKDYVKSAIGKSTIVDTRMPDFFFGVSKLDFIDRAGHISGAVNLPSAWIFTKDGTYKSIQELEAIAQGVVGTDKNKEIITYCDTGRLSSGWWFVLTKILGYKNVKMYDGSTEDWAKDTTMPMSKYTWK